MQPFHGHSSWEESQGNSRQTWVSTDLPQSSSKHHGPEHPHLLGLRPELFISFLTTSNQVFLGLPLGLAPSTSIYVHSFPHPILFFFPLHMTKPPQPQHVYHQNTTNCLYAQLLSILSLNSALVFLPQRGTTRPPNHLHLCSLQPRFMLLLHWPCLTSIHHAASDTVPIDFTFQFERCSFESQDGRQLSDLLPHNHRRVNSTIFIQHFTYFSSLTLLISCLFLFVEGNQNSWCWHHRKKDQAEWVIVSEDLMGISELLNETVPSIHLEHQWDSTWHQLIYSFLIDVFTLEYNFSEIFCVYALIG